MFTGKIVIGTYDHASALKIRREVFVLEQSIPEDIEVDQYEITCEHFLTKVKDLPAATGRLRVKDQYIKFERIATLIDFRGMGVGSHLMEFMLNYALENHSSLTPYMHSRVDAKEFYEKLGWSSVGEIFYDVNIAHIAMIFKKPKN
jgi:predicted GNAT family N-acyltransferase